MVVRFTINERRDIHFGVAEETINSRVAAWGTFVSSHVSAVQELNGLASEARNRETVILKDRTRTLLAGANVNALVDDGILKNASEPYRAYLESLSGRWLRTAAEQTLTNNFSSYRDDLNQLLNNSRRLGRLGTYFFVLSNFRITPVRSTNNTLTVVFVVDLDIKVTLTSDDSTVDVDKDTVDLRGLFEQVRDRYLDDMENRLRDQIEPVYATQAAQFRDSIEANYFIQMNTIIGPTP